MTGRYLLRLDDACHSMDWGGWQKFEELFDRLGIKPIVAVVPDNHDRDLQYASPNPLFWDRVRSWQSKGWTIAMHGYQHVMHSTKAKLILPFYERSEFGGLPYEAQVAKIREVVGDFRCRAGRTIRVDCAGPSLRPFDAGRHS